MNPILEEMKQETAERLATLARARGKSVDDYLKSLLPSDPEETDDEETIGRRLARKSLIGLIDSSQPDPDSPPLDTPFGRILAEKFKKQWLTLP
jgi:hypothetical protein